MVINRERLVRPPDSRVNRVLQQYYENLLTMDRLDALCIYRNNMGRLYKLYNPTLYVRFWKREHFLPREDDYYED